MLSKVLIFQGFREFGDCSPWRLECLFLIRKGRFLISFSNFGGRTFSHMLISTLLGKGVGATGKPGHFRTLFPFSVSGKTVVGLLLRRQSLYPTELRVQEQRDYMIFRAFCQSWRSNGMPVFTRGFTCRATLVVDNKIKHILLGDRICNRFIILKITEKNQKITPISHNHATFLLAISLNHCIF